MQLSAYKINLANEAIKEKKESGKTYKFFSEEKGIPYGSLCRWIKHVEETGVIQ